MPDTTATPAQPAPEAQDTTAPPATSDAPPATGDELGEKGQKALEAERSRAKEAEKRAKALERELEQHRQASMSEAEKAVAEAEKRGETAATQRLAGRLVDAELRIATAGRSLTTDALLTFDRNNFLTDDGDVDREGLTKWVEQHSQPADSGGPRLPSFDGGVRTTPPAPAGMNGLIRKAAGRA